MGLVSFFVGEKTERRNLIAEKTLKIHYDLDGCYSLLIAIILNVGASKAWSLYERGRNKKNSFDISQLRNSDGMQSKQQASLVLKQKGCSNEVIAEYLNCDPSTVKRKFKEWRKEENDGAAGVCRKIVGNHDKTNGK